MRKSVKLPKFVGLGNGHSEEKSEAERGKQRQGASVTRESAGSVVERAVVMTLRRAEVNEGGACLPCAGKKRRVFSGRSHPLVVGNPEKCVR